MNPWQPKLNELQDWFEKQALSSDKVLRTFRRTVQDSEKSPTLVRMLRFFNRAERWSNKREYSLMDASHVPEVKDASDLNVRQLVRNYRKLSGGGDLPFVMPAPSRATSTSSAIPRYRTTRSRTTVNSVQDPATLAHELGHAIQFEKFKPELVQSGFTVPFKTSVDSALASWDADPAAEKRFTEIMPSGMLRQNSVARAALELRASRLGKKLLENQPKLPEAVRRSTDLSLSDYLKANQDYVSESYKNAALPARLLSVIKQRAGVTDSDVLKVWSSV